MTLIEVLVVLIVLSILSAIALGAMDSLPPPQIKSRPESLRAKAILTGEATTTWDSLGRLYLYLPDGRVVAAGRDPLTGAPDAR